jgi:hypothetical protein
MTERALDRLGEVDRHAREALPTIDPLTGRGIAVACFVYLPGAPVWSSSSGPSRTIGRESGGSALLAELTRRARDEGDSRFRAYVLAINGRSIALLRRAGFRGRPGRGTLREYELALGGSGSER